MITLPHAVAPKREPKLSNRKLTEAETEHALRYLREYVKGRPRPALLAATAMRCSIRTAERILAVGQPFCGRLKRRYAVNMSARTGMPLESILRTCWQGYREHLGGWMDVQLPSMACKIAAELACGIAARAQQGYGVRTDYTVTHGVNGRPVSIELCLYNLAGNEHRITLKESALWRGLHMVYLDRLKHPAYNGKPDVQTIERALALVASENRKIYKNGEKNITAGTRDKSRRSKATQRGGRPD